MNDLIPKVGPYAIRYSPADFSTVVRCIIYQQLSGKVASRLLARLHEALGAGHRVTPRSVLRLEPEAMHRLGLSKQKIRYIREFAEGCLSGAIDLKALPELPDEEVMRRLTARRGIGPWTAHMYLIFALRRLDVLPVGDLGVRVAARNVYGLKELPAPAALETLAEPWRPYCTVATWYLWRSLGDGAGLDPE